ncbi:hypothetical protein [Gaoshiqia sediminis]|uniref:FeoB-associated Cys-rich membrane protein n=1 Tax=Gaoshiqia sediminis TaxID=2986998 RepID=A0AA41YEV6_9BACT|nr:hypothetical protein [Gaoshiqia sediminis]MCW0484722.1 hypothetical protein [Gaoshiqia sediminis]
MIQEIITYLIIVAAVGSVFLRLYKLVVRLSQQKSAGPNGKCGGCSAACALRDLPAAKSCSAPQKARLIL